MTALNLEPKLLRITGSMLSWGSSELSELGDTVSFPIVYCDMYFVWTLVLSGKHLPALLHGLG